MTVSREYCETPDDQYGVVAGFLPVGGVLVAQTDSGMAVIPPERLEAVAASTIPPQALQRLRSGGIGPLD